MNQVTKGFNIIYVFPIVILCYTFTLLWGWIPRTQSVITIAIGLGASVVVSHRYFSLKPIRYLLLYAIVVFFNVISDDASHNSFSIEIYNLLFILIPVLMTFGILRSDDERLINYTIWAVFGMLIINTIGTYIVDMSMPGSIRSVYAIMQEEGTSAAIPFYKVGMANYELPHALPTIIPVLVLGYKTSNKNIHKFIFAGVLVACFLLIFYSGATTSVLLGVFAFLISAITNTHTAKKQFVAFSFFAIVFILILRNDALVLSFLDWIDGLVGTESFFHNKIIEFEDAIIYGQATGDMEERSDLYMTSWKAVVTNPILGVNEPVGGHSFFIDIWATLGLIGWIPLLFFVFSQLKMFAKSISEYSVLFYYEGAMMAILMLTFKSTVGWESWLFLFTIMPVLVRYCEINALKYR